MIFKVLCLSVNSGMMTPFGNKTSSIKRSLLGVNSQATEGAIFFNWPLKSPTSGYSFDNNNRSFALQMRRLREPCAMKTFEPAPGARWCCCFDADVVVGCLEYTRPLRTRVIDRKTPVHITKTPHTKRRSQHSRDPQDDPEKVVPRSIVNPRKLIEFDQQTAPGA